LKAYPGSNFNELLPLSAMIAIKLRARDLSAEERRRFAHIFRILSLKYEAGIDSDTSLWDAFWGRRTSSNAKVKNEAENNV
jgi:hypothetical protein